MGYQLDFGDAVIIESLMHAVRGAAFAVPGALGAQEGGLIVLCAIFGMPPEAALALSLVKRIPDLVIGVPGLSPGRRWRAGISTAPAAPLPTIRTNGPDRP